MSNRFPLLALVLAAACAGPEAPLSPQVAEAGDALSAQQCLYFSAAGKVKICHATGSKKNPYTLISVSDQGCIAGHAKHTRDYVAVDDPTCSGAGSLPPGAPCDATLACSAGYECRDGICAATDLCAGVTCTSTGACDYAYCDPASGQCVHEGTSDNDCSDGNACTSSDSCDEGSCAGSPVATDDADACTADSCDPATGVAHASIDPDDGDPCTADSCDPATGARHDPISGNGCGPAPTDGCSDGTREGFTDDAAYPGIAACSGGWSIPGVRTSATVDPACGRVSGNTSSNPSGAGCNVADLCSPGWHVCNDSTEVQARTGPSGCADANANDAFFVQRQASSGYYYCYDSGDLDTYQNDMWGCGGTSPLMSGLFTSKPCGVLNATTGDGGGGMAAPWNLNVGGLSSYVEAASVTKSGSERGGVLCCAD